MVLRIFTLILIYFISVHTHSLAGQEALGESDFIPRLMVPVGHAGIVSNACMSPDEKYILTYGVTGDHTVKLWEVVSGKLIFNLTGHSYQINSAFFNHDGSLIATADNGRNVIVWSGISGKKVYKFEDKEEGFSKAYFSPSGEYLYYKGKGNSVVVRNTSDGSRRFIIPDQGASIFRIVYNPGYPQIAISTEDGRLRLWNMTTGELQSEIAICDTAFSLDYTDDGNTILTYGNSSSIQFIDSNEGIRIKKFEFEKKQFLSARINPHENLLLGNTMDGFNLVWDLYNDSLRYQIEPTNARNQFAKFSTETGRILFKMQDDSTFAVRDARSGSIRFVGSLLTEHRKPGYKKFDPTPEISRVEFIRSDSFMLTLSKFRWFTSPNAPDFYQNVNFGEIEVWDTYSGERVGVLGKMNNIVRSFVTSNEGRLCLIIGWGNAVWDIDSGKRVFQLEGSVKKVTHFEFDREGRRFLTAPPTKVWYSGNGELVYSDTSLISFPAFVSIDPPGKPGRGSIISSPDMSTIDLIDPYSGIEINSFKIQNMQWAYGSPTANRTRLTSIASDSTYRIHDLASGKLIKSYKHIDFIDDARLDASNNYLVVQRYNTPPYFVDLESDTAYTIMDRTGFESLAVHSTEPIWALSEYQFTDTSELSTNYLYFKEDENRLVKLDTAFSFIPSLKFSNNGNILAIVLGDRGIEIWDIHAIERLRTLTGDFTYINDCFFSPDDQYLLATCNDDFSIIWNVQSGEEVGRLEGLSNLVRQAGFHPSGDLIYTLDTAGELKFWSFPECKELFTLYYNINEKDWLVIHPSGLFDASPGAMNSMYFTVGREVIELEQLKERFYEPGLFELAMNGKEDELRRVDLYEPLDMYPGLQASIQGDSLVVHLEERNGGIGNLNLLINNKEVLIQANPHRDTSLTIDLSAFQKYYRTDTFNQIGLRVYNEAGWLRSRTYQFEYRPTRSKGNQQNEDPEAWVGQNPPEFHAIIIGTSDYSGNRLDLRYADKDSKDMYDALSQTASALFGKDHIHLHWLSTYQDSNSMVPTKTNIKARFDSIALKARPEDVLFLYLSGHGVSYGPDGSEQFYYLTKDVSSGALDDPAIRENFSISTEEMTNWINEIPAQKQVMILDACSSGNVVEDLIAQRSVPAGQIRALDRMKDRTGMFVLAGSAANQVSYEASQFGQGLLTYSILLGLNGGALGTSGNVDVVNLFQFARDKVPELARNIGGIQTPTIAFPNDASSFDIGIVNEQVRIPLKKVKPIFTRSAFQEESSFSDVLQIGESLDLFMQFGQTAGRGEVSTVFLDVNRHIDAYSIRGRYSVENGTVSIRGKLFKGDESRGDFQVEAEESKKDELILLILEEIEAILNSPK